MSTNVGFVKKVTCVRNKEGLFVAPPQTTTRTRSQQRTQQNPPTKNCRAFSPNRLSHHEVLAPHRNKRPQERAIIIRSQHNNKGKRKNDVSTITLSLFGMRRRVARLFGIVCKATTAPTRTGSDCLARRRHDTRRYRSSRRSNRYFEQRTQNASCHSTNCGL